MAEQVFPSGHATRTEDREGGYGAPLSCSAVLDVAQAMRRFFTLPSELRRLSLWLREQGVEEAVLESTAQYWRSVWLELEPYLRLHLAQAFSNRGFYASDPPS